MIIHSQINHRYCIGASSSHVKELSTLIMGLLRGAVFWYLGSVLLLQPISHAYQQSRENENTLAPDVCTRLVHQIYKGHVIAPSPPDIAGVWTSHRCEVRPGPEYITRKYMFDNESNFRVQQYYYLDVDCSMPLFTLVAEGTYEMYGSSWTVPGGTEMDYYMDLVYIIPHSQPVADYLSATIRRTCADFATRAWRPKARYELYSYLAVETDGAAGGGGGGGGGSSEEEYMMERDCTRALNFSLHELQLVRVEERSHHHSRERALYLGDIHTDQRQRQTYRPSSYQMPLLHSQTAGCVVCRALLNSDEFHPPTLHTRHHTKSSPDLIGEWFSERCETRPNSMFLTRRLVFSPDNYTWAGHYYHYADALCREPMFTILARGNYHPGPASTSVQGGFLYDFRVTSAEVTPEDDRSIGILNGLTDSPCGSLGEWEVGVSQDVTSTNGCRQLGLKVPHVEYELLSVETEHHKTRLFLGQRPSDGLVANSPTNRPTAYQPPMVKCARLMGDFTPPVTRRNTRTRSGGSVSQLPVALLIGGMLFALCFRG